MFFASGTWCLADVLSVSPLSELTKPGFTLFNFPNLCFVTI